MRRLDKTAIEHFGIPGIVLMENASRGVFEVIASAVGDVRGKRALIVCGKGNNGGDGFAAARHLHNAGAAPTVALAAARKEIAGDAAVNLRVCEKLKIPITIIGAEAAAKKFAGMIRGADFVVDALLGTGVRGPVKPLFASIIGAVNEFGGEIFAVDVPSGLSVDDGKVHNICVRATRTVTFGMPKIGLYVYPGAEFAGKVYVVDIGIPVGVLSRVDSRVELTPRGLLKRAFAPPERGAHKGDCGKLLIVGGSRGMSGAAALAAAAALRTGAGLVYIAAPESLANIIDRKITEGVVLPMPESGGALCETALPALVERAARVDAMVLGPGIGLTDGVRKIVAGLLRSVNAPLIIDADALNVVSAAPGILSKTRRPAIVTPHAGEMARLTSLSAADVQGARLETAVGFARQRKTITLLKGAYSIIASPRGEVRINPTGNPGMATAGSGDVLSGIIGALAARGVEPFDAAAAGAWLHGAAGDLAAATAGQRGMTASDIVRKIPAALMALKR